MSIFAPPLMIDAEALVIDKPAGMPVDPPRSGDASVVSQADELCFGFYRAPVPLHRLDRDTSGCLLLARNPKSLKRLQQAFEQKQVEKAYLAIVDGVPQAAEGTVALSLSKISTAQEGWRMIVAKRGQAAITHWQLIASHDGKSLLRLRPETGRTHQLRVHMASGLGLPITGDGVYGVDDERGMCLHACSIKVPRAGKEPIAAHAPFPARFAAWGFADPDA